MVDEAKSHTQVAQLTTAVVVAIVLLFLTKPLQYLPNAVLSSVVFLIGIKLIDIANMREILRLRKDEFVVALITTIVVVVVGVEQGIILAIILSLVLHVHRHYAPHDVVVAWDGSGHPQNLEPGPGVQTEPGVVVYRFGAGVFYANAQRLSDEVLELAGGDDPPEWFILDGSSIDDVDFTGGKTLAELADELRQRGVVVAAAAMRSSVRLELQRFRVTPSTGAVRVFDTVEEALAAFREETGRR
jgi:MFS superfamily sulfate permease-like transporter